MEAFDDQLHVHQEQIYRDQQRETIYRCPICFDKFTKSGIVNISNWDTDMPCPGCESQHKADMQAKNILSTMSDREQRVYKSIYEDARKHKNTDRFIVWFCEELGIDASVCDVILETWINQTQQQ